MSRMTSEEVPDLHLYVYQGGTAMLPVEQMSSSASFLRLFDTCAGMPATAWSNDWLIARDFTDTSLEAGMERIPGDLGPFYNRLIPHTFAGLESSRIAFAQIDLDLYSAILVACEFIFPRLCVGGFIIFDDYGEPSCPGARVAVDEYFESRNAVPLVLPTGQAIVLKSLAEESQAI
jgi:O-methyltransferase